ncbi:MAG: hypothetical protein D6696_12930 [Acidobacteria bacterium]|nr:MAG: hypothetical protein D6696_12930 [Acidobacteriota bacterium]
MEASGPRRGSRLALTVGLMAIFGGLWLFLDAQGVGVPPFKRLWPTLLLLGAGAALADLLFLSRRPQAAGWTVTWLGFGVLGFTLTLGYTNWRKILDWLPTVPTIFGLSLLATWLAEGRRNDNLVIAGGVLIGLGLVGFAARFDFLQRILPSAQVAWAVLLLAGGGYLVWRTLAQARR